MKQIEIGKGRCLTKTDSCTAILSIGPLGNDVQTALNELLKEGIKVSHYDMIYLKPIDEEILKEVAKTCTNIVTIEDGTLRGGLATTVRDWLNRNNHNIEVTALGIDDKWIDHGTVEQLRSDCGYDINSIISTIKNLNDNK